MPWRNARSVNILSLAVPFIGVATLIISQTIGQEEYRRNAAQVNRLTDQVRFAIDSHGGLAQGKEVEVPIAQPAARTTEGAGLTLGLLTLATLAVRLGFPALAELGKSWQAVQERKIDAAGKDREIAGLKDELARERVERDQARHDARHAERDAKGRAADAWRLTRKGVCPNSPEGKIVSCPFPPPPPSDDAIPVPPDASGSDLPTVPPGPTRT
jgi:hypothetical protein